MTAPGARPLGSNVEPEADHIIVTSYAVHAGTATPAGPPTPAEPVIILEVAGVDPLTLKPASAGLIIPEALAIAIRDATNVSLAQLEHLRRRPR